MSQLSPSIGTLRRFPNRSARLAGFVCALWATLTVTSAQAAKSATARDSDAGESPAYRNLIKEGLAEYDAFHFEEARSLFLRAHAMSPSARTHRAIGMTCFELRDYVCAVRNLSTALNDERRPLSPDQGKHAEDLLSRSQIFVDVVTLALTPPSARVLMDGAAAELEPDGTLLLDAGNHVLEASAPGMNSRSFPVSVKGGQHRRLVITLEAGRRALSPSALDASLAQARAESSNGAAKAWLIAGGAAGLAAVGSGILWMNRKSQLDSCKHPASGWSCTNESALSDQHKLAMGATIATGAAAVTMGIIGILSWHSKPAAARHAQLDCSLSPFGISCGQKF
jgi:hypothetical protein